MSRSTVDSGWERHFLDSAQLWNHAGRFDSWVDIGSGAGFPGLVLAIISRELRPSATFTLIESDARKCAFLRNVSRETQANATVVTDRIENVTGVEADILSARALATVDSLLESTENLLKPTGCCLFLKGRKADEEVDEARKNWIFKVEKIGSRVDEDGCVLRIEDVQRGNSL